MNASEELEKLEGRKEVLKERKKNAAQNKSQLEKAIVEGEAAVERLSCKRNRETEHPECSELGSERAYRKP